MFPSLKHFKPAEFRIWAARMHPVFLLALDNIRDVSEIPIMISPAAGALGRTEGSKTSQHYIKGPKTILKVSDVMPYKVTESGSKQAVTLEEMMLLIDIAKELGMTGIGIYPRWKPYPGLHLDMREPKTEGHIATWAGLPVKTSDGIKQKYFSMKTGITHFYDWDENSWPT